MSQVKIKDNESLENALRRFKKQTVSGAGSAVSSQGAAVPFDLQQTLKNFAFIPIILIIAALYLLISENLKAHNRRKAEKAREARMNSMMGSTVDRRRK